MLITRDVEASPTISAGGRPSGPRKLHYPPLYPQLWITSGDSAVLKWISPTRRSIDSVGELRVQNRARSLFVPGFKAVPRPADGYPQTIHSVNNLRARDSSSERVRTGHGQRKCRSSAPNFSTLWISFPTGRDNSGPVRPHAGGAPSVTIHQVRVNHADRLHERVHRGGSHKSETFAAQGLGKGN